MSIVAMKNKYLASKNLSHNREFSLHSHFNSHRKSVANTGFILNKRKKWTHSIPKIDDIDNVFVGSNYDPLAFKKIYNNWVQPIQPVSDAATYKHSCLVNISNNVNVCRNKCNVNVVKDLGGSSQFHTMYYNKRKQNAILCGLSGFNKPFPYAGNGAKLTYLTCKPPVVLQAYKATNYYNDT